jgi:hypothetical protein
MPHGQHSAPIVKSLERKYGKDQMLIVNTDRALRVPESEAQQSGLALDQVRIKKEYGGGYPANVEGLHHLHCLVRTAPGKTDDRQTELTRRGRIY